MKYLNPVTVEYLYGNRLETFESVHSTNVDDIESDVNFEISRTSITSYNYNENFPWFIGIKDDWGDYYGDYSHFRMYKTFEDAVRGLKHILPQWREECLNNSN